MSISKQAILDAFHYRHACKQYDPTKKISETDFQFILETARLSPSSFGFEPWRFLVIENPAIRELIRDNAWGAKDKVMDCSHFVVILVRQPETLLADGDYVQHIMRDVHHIPDEPRRLRQGFYRNFSENDFGLTQDPIAFYHWACRQSYIALANMLTASAMIGIDSTAIEGFPLEKMDKLFVEQGLYDPSQFKLSVMAAFGYRAVEPKAKTRQAMEDVVE
ncbi:MULTISPECIES: NAD(P)H-dependent oxidoreductase [Glaesserella]|uniref:NAD(P)H-dependent oxidoreductase n=1 Tax=Glaesserella australis TaxID=2094024 RepID=A0A328BZ66_9PAST|nr:MULTISPECIES: NAD(P)H-dependent oxidoreductase [Glaesserella]AUI66913.1 NAD(P)H-dependent oxidoreductase [Glaesserella sp. 15-184]RAL19523.1 NAD(P)H-dependent oxidoreductase [Glaesserella australis]